jgi:hypothetical protein
MFALIITIEDEDGVEKKSWSIHDTEEEAKTAYESVKENPLLKNAFMGLVYASTEPPISKCELLES